MGITINVYMGWARAGPGPRARALALARPGAARPPCPAVEWPPQLEQKSTKAFSGCHFPGKKSLCGKIQRNCVHVTPKKSFVAGIFLPGFLPGLQHVKLPYLNSTRFIFKEQTYDIWRVLSLEEYTFYYNANI